MKKILLVVLLAGCSIFSSLAQTSKNDKGVFSIGLEGGLPVGSFSDSYTFGFGGSIKYDYPVATSLYLTGSAGYTIFPYKSDIRQALQNAGLNSSAPGFIPIKIGAKYYFNGKTGFFGEGQIGATIGTKSGYGTAFAYSPGIGYTFDGGFEGGVRYEAWSKNGTFGQFGIRLAYRFQ